MSSQRADNGLVFLFRIHSDISAEVSPGFVQFLLYNDRVVHYLELGGHLMPKC